MTPEPSNVYFGSKKVLCEPEDYKLVVIDGRIEKVPARGKEYQAAMQAHDRVTVLWRDSDSCRFELAKVLYEIREKRHFQLIGPGYSTLVDYFEKEHDMTVRTVNCLIKCWEYYGIQHADYPRMLQGAKSIGWKKAYDLVGIIDPENMNRWFSFCETSNTIELGAEIKEYRRLHLKHERSEVLNCSAEERLTRPARGRFGKQVETVVRRVSEDEAVKEDAQGKGFSLADILGEDPFAEEKEMIAQREIEARATPSLPETTEAVLQRVKDKHGDWTSMVFDVPTEDRFIVSEAIKAAQDHSKTKNRGVALVHVCTHFASEFTTDYREHIGDWLSVIERVTGLKLAAVDTEKRQIVYGQNFLEREAMAS